MSEKEHTQSIAQGVIPSPFAGSWYPGTRTELESVLRQTVTEGRTESDTIALILPHAGIVYSGETAGAAVSRAAGLAFDRVILFAPSHRAYLENKICLPSAKAFLSPLGRVDVDAGAVEQLAEDAAFLRDDRIQENEHSTQMELPFLQYALKPGFRILPMIVGVSSSAFLKEAACKIRPWITEHTLVVVSSDFTHYGPDYGYVPFVHDPAGGLKALDMGAIHFIEKKSPDNFRKYIEKTGATVCGSHAIELLLNLLPENAACVLDAYSTSGEKTGNFKNSVSYAGISVSGSWKTPSGESGEWNLTDEDKKGLLQLARASIARKFDSSRPLPDTALLSPAVHRKTGVFVTLKIGDQLRGCIGEIQPSRPLVKAVAVRAVDAALHDPRFYPLKPEELGRVTIEISALTPPVRVASWKEIKIGIHGILMQKDGSGAVFLPQVAPEQGWDLAQTLLHLSMKAGLEPDAWKEGAEFEVFEAVVFHE